MARAPACDQLETEDALLTKRNSVESTAVDLEERAAPLVHDEVGPHLLGVLLTKPFGAHVGAELLVGGDDHLELAARGSPAGAREVGSGRDLGRDLVLHVLAAAALDETVDHVSRPGAEGPLVGIGRDGVHVADQGEGGAVGVALEPRDDVRAVGLALEQLDLEPGFAEDPRDVLLRGALVPRRVDGVEAEELGEELDSLAPERARPGRGGRFH